MKQGCVYIVSNKNRTFIYIGVTNNLERRILEHKSGYGSFFTKKYNLNYLVYYEIILGMQNAINREKQLKNWRKDWKWDLIKADNPELKDLAEEWFTEKEIEEYRQMRRDSETGSEST